MSLEVLDMLPETNVDNPAQDDAGMLRNDYHTTFRGLTFQQDYLTSPVIGSDSPGSTGNHVHDIMPNNDTSKSKPVMLTGPALPPSSLPVHLSSDVSEQSPPPIPSKNYVDSPPPLVQFNPDLSSTLTQEMNESIIDDSATSPINRQLISNKSAPPLLESRLYNPNLLAYQDPDTWNTMDQSMSQAREKLSSSVSNTRVSAHLRDESEFTGFPDFNDNYPEKLKRLSQASLYSNQLFDSSNLSKEKRRSQLDIISNPGGSLKPGKSGSIQEVNASTAPDPSSTSDTSWRHIKPTNEYFLNDNDPRRNSVNRSRSLVGEEDNQILSDRSFTDEQFMSPTPNQQTLPVSSSYDSTLYDQQSFTTDRNYPQNYLTFPENNRFRNDEPSLTTRYIPDVNFSQDLASQPYRGDSSFSNVPQGSDHRSSNSLVDQVFYEDDTSVGGQNIRRISLNHGNLQRPQTKTSNRESTADLKSQGGVDREGGLVLTFPVQNVQTEIRVPDIIDYLNYLRKLPKLESQRHGFTVVIDKRDENWKTLLPVLVAIERSIIDYVKQIICVIKGSSPNHVILSNVRREMANARIEPIFVQASELSEFISLQELTVDLGGDYMYNHFQWVDRQLEIEKFMQAVQELSTQLDELDSTIGDEMKASDIGSLQASLYDTREQRVVALNRSSKVIQQGQSLLVRLKTEAGALINEQTPHAALMEYNDEHYDRIHATLSFLEDKMATVNAYCDEKEQSLQQRLDLLELEQGGKKVVDWILGPGEKLLSSQVGIGESKDSAEELRKRHEEIELKCLTNYAQYAELRHRSELMMSGQHPAKDDIKAHMEYMDTVCRSFASAIQRRRHLLITSIRFHRSCEMLNEKMNDLLRSVEANVDCPNVESAESSLDDLQRDCEELNDISKELQITSQSLTDELGLPVKQPSGRSMAWQYDDVIKDVRDKKDDLLARKLQCDALADLRRLQLQQILQLRVCERDTDQAIQWLSNLCDNMLRTQDKIGRNTNEAKQLQLKQDTLIATATRAHTYGRQLLDASLVLRRSLTYDLAPNHDEATMLEAIWRRLEAGAREKMNRLTVVVMFRESVDRLLSDISQFKVLLKNHIASGLSIDDIRRNSGHYYSRILDDHKGTDDMGHMLIDRLSRPLLANEQNYQRDLKESCETISQQMKALKHHVVDISGIWYNLDQLSPLTNGATHNRYVPDKRLLDNFLASPDTVGGNVEPPNPPYSVDRQHHHIDNQQMLPADEYDQSTIFPDSTEHFVEYLPDIQETTPEFEHTYTNLPTQPTFNSLPSPDDLRAETALQVPMHGTQISDSPSNISMYSFHDIPEHSGFANHIEAEPVYATIKENGFIVPDAPNDKETDLREVFPGEFEELEKPDPEQLCRESDKGEINLVVETDPESQLQASEEAAKLQQDTLRGDEDVTDSEDAAQSSIQSCDNLRGILKKPLYRDPGIDLNEHYTLHNKQFDSANEPSVSDLLIDLKSDTNNECSLLVSESTIADEMAQLESVLREVSDINKNIRITLLLGGAELGS